MNEAANTGVVTIEDEMRPLLNHIVLVHDDWIGRLVGIHRDAMDVYYHVRVPDHHRRTHGGRNDVYASCVGACVSLSGIERYDRLEEGFTLNGCPPVDEFILSDANRAENLAMYGMNMVDGRHPSCDRIAIHEDDPARMVWWVLVRGLDGRVAIVEENDAASMRNVELPEGTTWSVHLPDLVRGKGGAEDVALLAAERAAAPCCADERDHPEFCDQESRRAEMETYGRRDGGA